MSDNTPIFDTRTRGDQPSQGSTAVDNGTVPREPEKLALSSEAVGELLTMAVQSGAGNVWFRGWVSAHGVPSWIAAGHWRFAARDGADVVRAEPPQER